MRWFHVEPQGINPCAYVPGLYTQAEVDDLINIDGYIPVADADELEKIRTGAVETMGGCSIWAGSYTTGRNKKYIQIFDIDFAAFGTFTSGNQISTLTGFVYDGNELLIDNVTSTRELFTNSEIGDLKNIRVVNMSFVKDSGTNGAGIVDVFRGGNIINCIVSNSNLSCNNGLIGGIVSHPIADTADINIEGCSVTNTTITNGGTVGGISGALGVNTFALTISNCDINLCTITGSIVGGISPTASVTVHNCSSSNSEFISTGNIGGIIGFLGINGITSNITDCSSLGNTYTGAGNNKGGIVGQTVIGTAIISISNCKNTSNINTSGENIGGIIGIARGTISITRCVNTGNITGTQRVAGIAGTITCQTFEENKNTGNITGTVMVGGMIGNLEMTSATFLTLRNLQSSGLITASGSESGGLIGRIRWGGNVFENSMAHCTFAGSTTLRGGIAGRQFAGATTNTQTYWDTTIGPATTASTSGTGQTTVALQTPTSNTGIYSAWTIPPWQFGTDTEYPSLTTTP